MGIFSSKKKLKVNTTVQRIFEDKQIPDCVKSGIIKGIISGGDIREFMMEEAIASIGIRATAAFNWAKDNYPYGVPTSGVKSVITAKDLVMTLIADEQDQSVTEDYYKFGPMNSIHFGWISLIDLHQYNPDTNEIVGISAETGFKCYLVDIVATYMRENYEFIIETNDQGMLEQWGPAPSSGYLPSKPFHTVQGIGKYSPQSHFEVSDTAQDDFITVTYEFENSEGEFIRRSINLAMNEDNGEYDYHQVRYVRADNTIGFWTYRSGLGTYPAIDAAYAMGYNDLGTFFPWCYFRVNGSSVKDASLSNYKKLVKYANYLGVQYDQLNDGVAQDPNVDDVQQCLLMFGVNPGAQSQAELEYLFKHFDVLHSNSLSQMQIADNLEEKFEPYSSSPSQVHYIRDKVFSMTFQFAGINKQRIPGKAAPVGQYTGYQSSTAYVYTRQILDSVYEQIIVYNLRLDYNINVKKGFSAGPGQPELLVPVDRAVLRTLSLRKKETLICKAMYMVVNTMVIIKTPWYASSIFKAIMIVVAIVITIFSAGTAWQSIVAAAAIGTTALVITVVTMIVTALAVNYAVKIFVKKFGPKIGIIAAVAAIAIGGYSAFGQTAGTSTWGESLLAVGNNLASESSNAYKDLYTDAMQEITDFQAYAEGQFKSLKEQREQLGLDPQFKGLDGLDIVRYSPANIWGERPDDYYSRTVHSGNVGVSCYDIVEGYHGFMLQLPKLYQTIEETTDGIPNE